MPNTDWRIVQLTAAASRTTTASVLITPVRMFSRRGSSHMGASQYLYAQVGEGKARLARCHRHQAVRCHAGRGIDLEERPRVVGAHNQIETTPSGAADKVESLERLLADRRFELDRDSGRAVVARIVREVLVLVVVVAAR